MLGVSMARKCPDQSGTEAARKAYVQEALKPASVPMLSSQPLSSKTKFDKAREKAAARAEWVTRFFGRD